MAALQHHDRDTDDTQRHGALNKAGVALKNAEQGLSDQIAALADQHPSVALHGMHTAMADLNAAVRMHLDAAEELSQDAPGGTGSGHVSGGQAVRHDDDATAGETQDELGKTRAHAGGEKNADKDSKDSKRGKS